MPYFLADRCLRKPRNVVCMRTVELLLNEELDGVVREVWRRLAAAGLPSLAAPAHPTNRPHLTLAAAADLPELGPALAGLPLAVTLRGLVLFEGKAAMLAWRVTADAALRELQARIWAQLAGVQRSPLHQPDRWVPHVSLAPRLSPTIATRVLADLAPATGWFVGARSYDRATRTATTLMTAG
jgi:2'-5' RNA ligase